MVGRLGRGSFGQVFKAETDKGEVYAIKRLSLHENTKYTKREIQIACKLQKHVNVVAFKEFFFHAKNPTAYLVMELCELGNLNHHLIEIQPPVPERILYFCDMANGLKYIHENKIIHRDLNPQNILLSLLNGRVICKIADFSISVASKGMNTKTCVGNLYFRSPEMVNKEGFSFPTDIFSLGLICFVMFTLTTRTENDKKYLVPEIMMDKKTKILSTLISDDVPLPEEYILKEHFKENEDVGKIVCKMLAPVPSERPDINCIVTELGKQRKSNLSKPKQRFVDICKEVGKKAVAVKLFQLEGLRGSKGASSDVEGSGYGSLMNDVEDGEIKVQLSNQYNEYSVK